MTKNFINVQFDKVQFQLQEKHDFLWLKEFGEVFTVFDQQDSGNISFGLENGNERLFIKYAGAKPVNFSGDPETVIKRLKESVPVYKDLKHPNLISLVDHFATESGYALIFKWFPGENLYQHWNFGGIAKYTNPKSPYYRFRKLSIEKRLQALDVIYSFHEHVESKGYVAVDFYDGSILYDFENDEMKICDIDYYRKAPTYNDIGENFWGSTRFKSPEEYVLGAPIDSRTNVYTMGATAFNLIGGELDRSFSKWEANERLYKVACKAVDRERMNRYATVKEFFEAWNKEKYY